MTLHLLPNTQMKQDGTYSIQEISLEQFEGTIEWAKHQGILQNHSYRHRKIAQYQRDYTLDNNDLFLIEYRGKYYNGTYINQCPNQ